MAGPWPPSMMRAIRCPSTPGTRPRNRFSRSFGFATGNLPVRIAACDLTGQRPRTTSSWPTISTTASPSPSSRRNGTFTTLTRPTGVGPSDIAFANLGGENGPAIVVSDQVSGDFTVLLNDSTPSSNPTFSQEYRYRAGNGLFGISLDPNTGEPTVLSQLQTVGIVAGTFTGSGATTISSRSIKTPRALRSFPTRARAASAIPRPATPTFPPAPRPARSSA